MIKQVAWDGQEIRIFLTLTDVGCFRGNKFSLSHFPSADMQSSNK